jgi:sugar lactone lactonase YvrE
MVAMGGLTGGYSGDGGPATDAALFDPSGVAVDGVGNVYIADAWNNRIRVVDTAGIINTIAGSDTGFAGDGGPATAALLFEPVAVKVDKYGNIYVTDWLNQRVRMIDTHCIITTIAGTGIPGYNGDGIPATTARLNYPGATATDKQGNLIIADIYNNRIRKVDRAALQVPNHYTPRGAVYVFPNPAHNSLTVRLAAGGIKRVEVTDIAGHSVYSATASGAMQQFVIDISELPAGAYLLRVNDTEAGKFVKE